MQVPIRWLHWSFVLLLVVSVTGCGRPPDPDAVTSNTDPIPVERATRSWWQQLFDRRGVVEGDVRDSAGRLIPQAGFSCIAESQHGDRTLIGQYTNAVGRYRCGGAPGLYTIEVYDPGGGGVIVSQQIEIKARQTTTVNLVAHPPQATPTATPPRCCS
jgi:hypothetical protein